MKQNRGIFWRIYRAYAIVIILALVIVLIGIRPAIRSHVINTESQRLTSTSKILHQIIQQKFAAEPDFLDTESETILEFTRALSKDSGLSVSFLDRLGPTTVSVMGESGNIDPLARQLIRANRGNPLNMTNYDDGLPTSWEYLINLHTIQNSSSQNEVYLLTSIPRSAIQSQINSLFNQVLFVFGIAVIISGIAAYILAVNFSMPLELMQKIATRFGRGDFSRKIPSLPNFELSDLAESLNIMATDLDRRIRQITSQRNEQEAILQSLREGVIAIDDNERILSLNHTAELLLGVSAAELRGSLVQEFLRHVELQKFIQKSLKGQYSQDDELAEKIEIGRDKILEVRSAPLRDAMGNDIGLIIVMTDVTLLNKLESLRKDFVANVSHELRTPITSIKGFTETLLDGALDEPIEARRFVEVIDRQSDRLGQVIEDLLKLSRLEQDDDLQREPVMLSHLLSQVAELCQSEAQAVGTKLNITCSQDGQVLLNTTLMEQALTNLVNNAIRYGGGEGEEVRMIGEIKGGKVHIRIEDDGPGIEKEHLPRLFERFYRVDKARSREVGGTGLGLSIVKHVATAHHGTVSVDSVLHRGTAFTIEVPAA